MHCSYMSCSNAVTWKCLRLITAYSVYIYIHTYDIVIDYDTNEDAMLHNGINSGQL